MFIFKYEYNYLKDKVKLQNEIIENFEKLKYCFEQKLKNHLIIDNINDNLLTIQEIRISDLHKLCDTLILTNNMLVEMLVEKDNEILNLKLQIENIKVYFNLPKSKEI